jgi:dipeptidyl-peptidase-4
MSNTRRWFVSLVLLSVLAPVGFAQGTLEDYQRAQRFLPGNLRHLISTADVAPHWIEKSNRFWYRRTGPKGSDFVLVDAERNTSSAAFDHARLAQALAAASKHEYSAADLPFTDFEFVEDGKAIRLSLKDAEPGESWICSLQSYDCQADVHPEKPNEVLSPNKRWAAFVRDHNLFLRDISTGTTLQLSSDGAPRYNYATPLPSLHLMVDQGKEDVEQPAAVNWSPDSSKLVTFRIDSRNSGLFTSLQFVPHDQLRPRAFTYVYPLPGEVLAKAEPIIFDIQSGKRIDVKSPPIALPFQDGPGFEWFADSKSFYYDDDDRGFKAKELRVVEAVTGEQKVLVREQAELYVDPGETFYRFAENSRELLWTSERDGWNHIYRYSKTGQLENQVTQGPWVVKEIDRVDDKNRKVYFLANGREKGEDPYLAHLYVVGFDGKGLQLLSPEDADHSVSFSPDGTFYLDSYSRADLLGEAVLRRTKDGSEVRVLERPDVTAIQQLGWKFAEPFQGKASDGTTDIYGLIWRPSNFDAAKK